MQGGWLSSLPIPAIGLGTFMLMLLAAASGHSLRRLHVLRKKGPRESQASVAQEGYLLGSSLGLLGLLLAFSFGMVLNRYEHRRELVTTEANAIGTAYLRAQLLDEPHRSRLSALLLAYAENRIQLSQADNQDAYMARNDHLLTAMWAAVRAARESALQHGITTALLLTFNEVIDLDTERKIAWQLRVPEEVLVLVALYMTITAGVVGYSIDGPRGVRAAFVLFVLLALSVTVITDVNRPISGNARESQNAMKMLLSSLKAQPPGAFDVFLKRTSGGKTGAP